MNAKNSEHGQSLVEMALVTPLLSEAIEAIPHEQRRELIDELIRVEAEN